MPLYEYRCQSCEEVVEVLQKMGDPPRRKCEDCGGRLEKLISQSGFVLKGSGWYVHEYGRKGKADGKPSGKAAAGDAADAAPAPKKEEAGSGEKAAAAAG